MFPLQLELLPPCLYCVDLEGLCQLFSCVQLLSCAEDGFGLWEGLAELLNFLLLNRRLSSCP